VVRQGDTGHAYAAASARASAPTPEIAVAVLGGFRVTCDGEAVALPSGAQRLLAFLAVHDRPMARTRVAFTLWEGASESRALGSLRSALWRLRRLGPGLVLTTKDSIELTDGIGVDLREGVRFANGMLGGDSDATDLAPLRGELLPDWYDSWVLAERERFNELRIRALEALCERSLEAGRLSSAVAAGLAAVRVEPLRESTHRALIRAYLAEGNHAQALAHYRDYVRRACGEVGIGPSRQLNELVSFLAHS
jgi:DNA-binding SARP family transcriptional activator